MLTPNKQNNFISFLLQKYNFQKEIKKIEGFLLENSDNKSKDFVLKENDFKKALLSLKNFKKESEDFDDYSSAEWFQNFEKHRKEINNLMKDVNLSINSQKIPKNKNLKEIEEKNNRIMINVSILSTTFVLTLFLLVFLPNLTFKTLNSLDSLVLYPFNKLEEAYNFNYNEEVFHVAKIDRGISSEMKSQYIKNINLGINNSMEDSLEISKNSIINSSKQAKNNFDDGIIVMGMDNSKLIEEKKDGNFKLFIKKIAEKQIELSNKISEKLLDLIY
jgi:hypothetical protein